LRAVAACIDLRLQRKEIVVGKAQRFHRDDKVFLGNSWRRVVENLEDESERMRSGGSEP
jgi:hypothetical protein